MNSMTIEKWLSDVHYDEFGTHIWNRNEKGGNQMVAEIRGWAGIYNIFQNANEAAKFQDAVAEFIVQAIREKVARTSSKTEISDEEIVNEAIEHSNLYTNKFTPRNAFIMGAIWYREQLKKKQ